MRNEFNKLKETLSNVVLFDEKVGIALNDLEQKIIEVEKRIECVKRTNNDSDELVYKLAKSFQLEGKLEEIIGYADFETLQRSVYDIEIALNMEDEECIDNNWYGLFQKNLEVVPTFEFHSSHGSITCDAKGNILGVIGEPTDDNYLYKIERIDMEGYGKLCEKHNVTHGELSDILTIGFWDKEGSYTEPDKYWLENVLGEVENAPTELCKTPQTNEFVKDIIAKLKVIDVDVETMQYILEQVGMDVQILNQLMSQL